MTFNRDAFIRDLDLDLNKVEGEVGDVTKQLRYAEGEIMALRAVLKNVLSAQYRGRLRNTSSDEAFQQFVKDEFDADQARGILDTTKRLSRDPSAPELE